MEISVELKRLQAEIGEINKQEALRQQAWLLRMTVKTGEIPQLPQVNSQELQIRSLLAAKVPEFLEMTERQFRESLPILTEPTEEIKAHFSTPILVLPEQYVPFVRQMPGVGDDDFGEGEKETIENATIKTKPYWLWVNDGSATRGKTFAEAQVYVQEHRERGLTFAELLALYRADVGLFFRNRTTYDTNAFDIAAGSSVTSSGDIPVIYHNYHDPLRRWGEIQVQAFSKDAVRPRAGWPSTTA